MLASARQQLFRVRCARQTWRSQMCRAHDGQRVVFMEGEEEPPEDLRLAEDLDYSSRSVLYDHLIDMGRARNRKFDALPVWAEQGWREVVTMRSNAQLKRCLETNPVFANASNEELHRYRERDVGWSGTAASSSRVSDSKDSSKGKARGRGKNPGGKAGASRLALYGPEESVAYTKHYLPGRFVHIKRALQEVRRMRPRWVPTRMLDFGCGPATALLAAAEVWPGKQRSATRDGTEGGVPRKEKEGYESSLSPIQKYVGIDMSTSMLDAAKTISRSLPQDRYTTDCTFWEDTSSVVKRAVHEGERYDLIVASFTLSELPSDAMREQAVHLLFQLLSEQGVLVLVEKGCPRGSHLVRSARMQLLNATPDVATVLAPCTHDGPCPLGKGFWCSFTQRPPRGSITNDKFSYVAIANFKTSDDEDESLLRTFIEARTEVGSDGDLASALQFEQGIYVPTHAHDGEGNECIDVDDDDGQGLDAARTGENEGQHVPMERMGHKLEHEHEHEEKEGEEEEKDELPVAREEWARVLRSPIKNKGHVVMDVCSAGGDIQRLVFAKANTLQYGHHSEPIYAPLYGVVRRTTWGGLTPTAITSHETGAEMSPLMRLPKGVSQSTFALSAQTRREAGAAAAAAAAADGRGRPEDGGVGKALGDVIPGLPTPDADVFDTWLHTMDAMELREVESMVREMEQQQKRGKGRDRSEGSRRRRRSNRMLRDKRGED